MPADGDLDETVRRFDPDGWLASRFIGDDAARADVIALHAFVHQLARVGQVTSSALLAEIRLTWWDEVLGEIYSGRPVRRHPVARSLARAVGRRDLPRPVLEFLIEAHLAPPGDPDGLADAVDGSLAWLTAHALDPRCDPDAARPAGRVIGLMRLARQGWEGVDPAAHLAQAALAARGLSPSALPAVVRATLARTRDPSPLETRVRLVVAMLRGRL